MNEHHSDFQYEPLLEVPKEYRQTDRTYIEYHDKPFVEGEEALLQLEEKHRDAFADSPFLYLHFLRAIEDRLMMLAIDRKQPLATCLKYLRRRLDLEYNRGDISLKASQAIVLAKYAAECGEIELAKNLLSHEREQLEEIATVCQGCLESVNEHLDRLTD